MYRNGCKKDMFSAYCFHGFIRVDTLSFRVEHTSNNVILDSLYDVMSKQTSPFPLFRMLLIMSLRTKQHLFNVIPNEHTHKIVIPKRESPHIVIPNECEETVPIVIPSRTCTHKLSFRTERSECEESFSRIEQGKISPVGRNDKREKVEMTKDRLK